MTLAITSACLFAFKATCPVVASRTPALGGGPWPDNRPQASSRRSQIKPTAIIGGRTAASEGVGIERSNNLDPLCAEGAGGTVSVKYRSWCRMKLTSPALASASNETLAKAFGPLYSETEPSLEPHSDQVLGEVFSRSVQGQACVFPNDDQSLPPVA